MITLKAKRNFLQIPFPAVTFCPDLNTTLLKQHVECRLRGHCNDLNSSQVSININALRTGCTFCSHMYVERAEIEEAFEWELIRDDAQNNTYIDYLKNFWDSSLMNQQSFCMSGRKNLVLRETLIADGGFCYIINEKEMFNEDA